MSTIVYDCDDVVANIRDNMAEVLSQLSGRNIHWGEWDTYDLSKIYGINIDDCLAAFLEHRVLERATLEPGARETIRAVRDDGYRIVMLTARGWHPHGDSLTREWLAAHDIIVDELRVVPLHASKTAVMEDTYVDFLVDDNPRHIIDAEGVTHIRSPVLMSRPWNLDTDVRHRINTLPDLVKLVREQDALKKRHETTITLIPTRDGSNTGKKTP